LRIPTLSIHLHASLKHNQKSKTYLGGYSANVLSIS
jgi:hypothetical protein